MTQRSWLRRAAGVAVTVAVIVSMAACGGPSSGGQAVAGPWEEVVAAAEDEGQVTFYSVMPDVQNERLVEAFNERYPDISVSVTRGAGELPPRVEAEIQSGAEGADVFLYSDPAWFAEHEANLLAADGPAVEGWSEEAWEVPSKAIIATTYPFSMFVWNTERFPQGFRTWEDLLDPAVKGALGLRSDVTTNVAAYLDFLETELGDEYLTNLGRQQPKFYPSVVPMTQAVASGEIGVTNASAPSTVKELQDQGAPIEWTVPEPSYWLQWGAAALANSKRQNAARVFLDFIMSVEGQTAINGDGFGDASRDGVEGQGPTAPEDAWKFESEKYTPEVIAEFEGKFDQWFGAQQ